MSRSPSRAGTRSTAATAISGEPPSLIAHLYRVNSRRTLYKNFGGGTRLNAISTAAMARSHNQSVPTVLRIDAFRFFFYSNEGHEPPHVHVQRQEDQAKFWLAPVRLAWTDGFSAATLNKLHRIVRAHEALFLEKWNEYFSR